jgi:hypothetical protein
MNIEVKVLLDTEKKRDLDMIEEVLFQLQDIKEMLEVRQENLNNNTKNKNRSK